MRWIRRITYVLVAAAMMIALWWGRPTSEVPSPTQAGPDVPTTPADGSGLNERVKAVTARRPLPEATPRAREAGPPVARHDVDGTERDESEEQIRMRLLSNLEKLESGSSDGEERAGSMQMVEHDLSVLRARMWHSDRATYLSWESRIDALASRRASAYHDDNDGRRDEP
jgi:hypothetical protein